MTVSPRWPQDDAATSSDVDHRLAAENGADSNMPPTLFRLPNLNPAPTTPDPVPAPAIPADVAGNTADVAGHTAVGHSSDNAIHGQTTSPAAPPLAISPAAADAAAVETHAADTSQLGDSQPRDAMPRQTFDERPAPVSDAPAGRSWMEVIRQHGVVVMLLLIVVATAIFTGRDSKNDPLDDAIVDAVDMGQIDEGIASDVPLPVHQHDSETGVAASQNSYDSAPSDVGSVSPALDPVVQTNDASPSSNAASTSFASLEPPQVDIAQDPADLSGNETNADATYEDSQSEVAAFEFVPPQVDAQTVANRFAETAEVDSDVAFNPPSLESLAESLSDGEPAVANDLGGVQANSFLPVSSKTPTGISNWLKFLPALPNDTSN